jgi:hypothetical protein
VSEIHINLYRFTQIRMRGELFAIYDELSIQILQRNKVDSTFRFTLQNATPDFLQQMLNYIHRSVLRSPTTHETVARYRIRSTV